MRRSVLVLLLCPFFGCAHSDSDDQSRRNRWTPFQFGIAKDIQLVNPTYDVLGARLNFVHGRNRDVKGLDVGFLNDTLGDAAGIQVAAFGHRVEGNSWGVQVGGFANRVGTEKRPRTHRGLQVGGVNFGGIRGIQVGGLSNGFFAGEHFHIELAGESKGLQISAGVNSSQKMTGAQIAGANWSKGDAVGLQLAGLVNFTDKELRGAQVSFVLNKANEGQGVQFGAINIVDHEFEGLQISAGVN